MRSVLLVLLAGLAYGQVFDATHVGEAVKLQGQWRFHSGDDPAWGQPGYDDSAWPLVSPGKSLKQRDPHGFFWLRAKVKLPSEHGPLEVYADEQGPVALYVNGKQAIAYGTFPPAAVIVAPHPKAYALPSGAAEIEIAVREWLSPLGFAGDSFATSFAIGTKDEVDKRMDRFVRSNIVQEMPDYIFCALAAVLCAGLFVLFALQRDRTEYLFLALALLAQLLQTVAQDCMPFLSLSLERHDCFDVVMAGAQIAFIIEFVFRFLGQPIPKWLRMYQLSMGFLWIPVLAAWQGWAPATPVNIFFLVYFIPYFFLLPGLLLIRCVRGSKEAGLLAIPLLLLSLDSILSMLGWILFELKVRGTPAPLVPNPNIGVVEVPIGTIWNVLFLLSIGALILIRFQKVRVAQVRAHAELEAARTMQEVMVPKAIAATGFQIDTAYIPAQEVGGDFFQMFPGEDGSLLVVIGDVSGKGMKAAMLVSMIVGLLRGAIRDSRSPAAVLRHLNSLLIGHTDDKFATCCCALFDGDGSVTAANAGHLSPYCDGEEIELPGALPLGMSADAAYEELRIGGKPGQRWVFLSDGVVEARDKSGQMYGFERTRVISIEAVHDIAESARRFGQEDDITVLGVAAEAPSYA